MMGSLNLDDGNILFPNHKGFHWEATTGSMPQVQYISIFPRHFKHSWASLTIRANKQYCCCLLIYLLEYLFIF